MHHAAPLKKRAYLSFNVQNNPHTPHAGSSCVLPGRGLASAGQHGADGTLAAPFLSTPPLTGRRDLGAPICDRRVAGAGATGGQTHRQGGQALGQGQTFGQEVRVHCGGSRPVAEGAWIAWVLEASLRGDSVIAAPSAPSLRPGTEPRRSARRGGESARPRNRRRTATLKARTREVGGHPARIPDRHLWRSGHSVTYVRNALAGREVGLMSPSAN